MDPNCRLWIRLLLPDDQSAIDSRAIREDADRQPVEGKATGQKKGYCRVSKGSSRSKSLCGEPNLSQGLHENSVACHCLVADSDVTAVLKLRHDADPLKFRCSQQHRPCSQETGMGPRV